MVTLVWSRVMVPTVTSQVVLRPVATDVQVMVAVPVLTPFTVPLLVTVAIFVLELFKVTLLSANVSGVTVAFSVTVLFFLMTTSVLSRLTPFVSSEIPTMFPNWFQGATAWYALTDPAGTCSVAFVKLESINAEVLASGTFSALQNISVNAVHESKAE